MAVMPLGTLDYLGRPLSLCVIAKAGREDLIFQFLSAFEDTFRKRAIPPQLLRSDEDTKKAVRQKLIR
jgi:amidase